MKDFVDFLDATGGLHDSEVTSIVLRPLDRAIEIHLDDIHANQEGLPGYPGPEPGVIILERLTDLDIAIDGAGPLRVFEFSSDPESADAICIKFWTVGILRARVGSAEYSGRMKGRG